MKRLDDADRLSYVSTRMNLLLILSALLSALSGLAGSGRATELQQVAARPLAASSSVQQAPVVARRVVVLAAGAALPAARPTLLPTPWRLVAVIAPWTARRRE